jgi:outer membrane protein assembly factor BamA
VRQRSGRAIARVVVIAIATLSAVDARADVPADTVHESEREVAVLPLVGGDTDKGFGGGALGSVAMFDTDHPMYRWKIAFGTFYATRSGVFEPSYVDAFALITIPTLLDDRLRLEIRPAYTRDTALKYFGVGNRPSIPAETDPIRDSYDRLHPSLSVLARRRLSGPWFALLGTQMTYNQIHADPDSTLMQDMATADPFLTRAHGVLRVGTGFGYDSRDNELSPTTGQYHQLKLRASPRIGDDLPYAYQQLNASARFYTTLVPRRLVFAVRGVLDIQTGDVPFYELSRYDDTSAIGGGQGVRGVPAYQFYGRVKAFANVELRASVLRFTAFDRKLKLGFATFVDAGRLWADTQMSHPEIDGTGTGLHYGVGGGIRLTQGRAFLIRADVAWSPDARPVGAYLLADEAF